MSRSGPRSDWAVANLDAIRALWLDGVSASAIAERFGVSKNAVIGLAHRNKFPARPNPVGAASRPPAPKGAAPRKRPRPAATGAQAKAPGKAHAPAAPKIPTARSAASLEQARARPAAVAAQRRVPTVAEIARACLFGMAHRAARPAPAPLLSSSAPGPAAACQWPLWPTGERAPSPPLFCGAGSVPGYSWRQAHCARAFAPRSGASL